MPPIVAGSVSVAAVWPPSTLETAVGAFAVESAGFTVSFGEPADVLLSGVVALSVTSNSNVYVSPTVRVFAAAEHETMFPACTPVPDLVVHMLFADV